MRLPLANSVIGNSACKPFFLTEENKNQLLNGLKIAQCIFHFSRLFLFTELFAKFCLLLGVYGAKSFQLQKRLTLTPGLGAGAPKPNWEIRPETVILGSLTPAIRLQPILAIP